MSLDICTFCGRTVETTTCMYHPIRGLGGGVYTPICSACARDEDITAAQAGRSEQ